MTTRKMSKMCSGHSTRHMVGLAVMVLPGLLAGCASTTKGFGDRIESRPRDCAEFQGVFRDQGRSSPDAEIGGSPSDGTSNALPPEGLTRTQPQSASVATTVEKAPAKATPVRLVLVRHKVTRVGDIDLILEGAGYEHLVGDDNESNATVIAKKGEMEQTIHLSRAHSGDIEYVPVFDKEIGLEVAGYEEPSSVVVWVR